MAEHVPSLTIILGAELHRGPRVAFQVDAYSAGILRFIFFHTTVDCLPILKAELRAELERWAVDEGGRLTGTIRQIPIGADSPDVLKETLPG